MHHPEASLPHLDPPVAPVPAGRPADPVDPRCFASRTLTEVWRRVQAGAIREGLAQLTALRADADLPLGRSDDVVALATMLDCRLARGDMSEAMMLGKQLTPRLADDGQVGALAHLAKGDLAAALGNPEVALDHFAEAGARAPAMPPVLLPWRAGAALAMVRVGQRQQAEALAHEHLAHARASGSDLAVAGALRTLASAELGGDRVQHLRQARTALEHTRAERLAAQIDTDLGGMLLLWPDHTHVEEAVGLLRGAEEYAGREELWPLQSRVRRLLDRLGEAPQRFRNEAMANLTASERRVARLAAAGRTNRQIAEELVVTIKAVEWHLSHVYRKLGITSRRQLATTLE